jgi:predicted oxidoreductase (fatty acid repression mutant protein)
VCILQSEEEELLWDVVEEALANVLPEPAYAPSTPAEEDTLARLVQKKVTDWMAYGKVQYHQPRLRSKLVRTHG